jgi:hypothetical protein
MENVARKLGLHINQEKTKYMIVERKNTLKQKTIGHLKIKNYKFERDEILNTYELYFIKITITKFTYKKE